MVYVLFVWMVSLSVASSLSFQLESRDPRRAIALFGPKYASSGRLDSGFSCLLVRSGHSWVAGWLFFLFFSLVLIPRYLPSQIKGNFFLSSFENLPSYPRIRNSNILIQILFSIWCSPDNILVPTFASQSCRALIPRACGKDIRLAIGIEGMVQVPLNPSSGALGKFVFRIQDRFRMLTCRASALNVAGRWFCISVAKPA